MKKLATILVAILLASCANALSELPDTSPDTKTLTSVIPKSALLGELQVALAYESVAVSSTHRTGVKYLTFPQAKILASSMTEFEGSSLGGLIRYEALVNDKQKVMIHAIPTEKYNAQQQSRQEPAEPISFHSHSGVGK